MPKFSDIKLITQANYRVTCPMISLMDQLEDFKQKFNLQLNPPFQRGHVWMPYQQKAYIEHILSRGMSGRELYFNFPNFDNNPNTEKDHMVCVDGLQRITAVEKFMTNQLKIFEGHYYRDYTDTIRYPISYFIIYVNDLETEKEVLEWYLALNSGGTDHTPEELNRVRRMIEEL